MKIWPDFLDEAQDTKIAENVLFIVSSVIPKSQTQAWPELDVQSPRTLVAQIFFRPVPVLLSSFENISTEFRND